MRPVLLRGAGLGAAGEKGDPKDANRLRRMDRFGRVGFLAGVRAFEASGAAQPSVPDPRAGVVVGTRHGCRTAILDHAARLAAASKTADLAPSVFAVTVHSTVNGELAMALGLGGVSETIVSGRTAGLEALILGARRVAEGDADRVLVVAAEGVDDAMRAAWEEERSAFGRRASGVELVETGAAVLLEAGETSSNAEERSHDHLRFVDGCLFFEPDARRAEARFFEWLRAVEARGGGKAQPAFVTLCTPAYEDFLEGKMEKARGSGTPVERLGASGMYEIARELAARRAHSADPPPPHSPSKRIRAYVSRDMSGAVAAVALESEA